MIIHFYNLERLDTITMAEKYPGDTDVSSTKGNNYDQNTKALIYYYNIKTNHDPLDSTIIL